MRIEQIRLKNFKMFQDVAVRDIQPFTVFVGANGSGKEAYPVDAGSAICSA
jgi:AAA15 family ATPase/GTPase